MKYVVKATDHSEEQHEVLWQSWIDVTAGDKDRRAKLYATEQTKFLNGVELDGQWERKDFGWVRWYRSLCISIHRDPTRDADIQKRLSELKPKIEGLERKHFGQAYHFPSFGNSPDELACALEVFELRVHAIEKHAENCKLNSRTAAIEKHLDSLSVQVDGLRADLIDVMNATGLTTDSSETDEDEVIDE